MPSRSPSELSIRMEGAYEDFLRAADRFKAASRQLERAAPATAAALTFVFDAVAKDEAGFQRDAERLHRLHAISSKRERRDIQRALAKHASLIEQLGRWLPRGERVPALALQWSRVQPQLETKLPWAQARGQLRALQRVSVLHTVVLLCWVPIFSVLWGQGHPFIALGASALAWGWIVFAEPVWSCPVCSGRHASYRLRNVECVTCGLNLAETELALAGEADPRDLRRAADLVFVPRPPQQQDARPAARRRRTRG